MKNWLLSKIKLSYAIHIEPHFWKNDFDKSINDKKMLYFKILLGACQSGDCTQVSIS